MCECAVFSCKEIFKVNMLGKGERKRKKKGKDKTTRANKRKGYKANKQIKSSNNFSGKTVQRQLTLTLSHTFPVFFFCFVLSLYISYFFLNSFHPVVSFSSFIVWILIAFFFPSFLSLLFFPPIFSFCLSITHTHTHTHTHTLVALLIPQTGEKHKQFFFFRERGFTRMHAHKQNMVSKFSKGFLFPPPTTIKIRTISPATSTCANLHSRTHKQTNQQTS